MASGIIHAQTDDAVGDRLVVGGLIAATVLGLPYLGFVVAGIVGRFVGPDADIHHLKTEQKHRVYRINWALGLLWDLYWVPYGVFAEHRGSSHTWVGTLGRFIYLYWICLVSFSAIAEHYPAWRGEIFLFWLFVLIGHAAIDRAHVRMDEMRYF
jgi:hypothetical protein